LLCVSGGITVSLGGCAGWPVSGGFALVGLLCAITTVWLATSGAWLSALATNGTNTYQSGSLTVTDDDAATALFSSFASPNDGYLTVGQTLTPRCLNLTYTGNWTDPVFTDPLTDVNAHWFRTDPAKVYTANGGIEIVPGPTWEQYSENNVYNFTNKSVQVELTQIPGGDGGSMLALKNSYGELIIKKGGTLLELSERIENTSNNVSVAWDYTQMRFFKITSIGQLIRWQYSANGINWVTGREKIAHFPLTNMFAALQAHASTPSAPNARFNNFRSSFNSGVRLYANPTGDLAPYLNLTIERGTGAAGGAGHSCAGFTSTSTVYTGTLAGMPTTYATGLDDWHPATSPETVSYRISAATNNDQTQQGKTASATFTWQAQAGA
jgi:hypothetical protein